MLILKASLRLEWVRARLTCFVGYFACHLYGHDLTPGCLSFLLHDKPFIGDCNSTLNVTTTKNAPCINTDEMLWDDMHKNDMFWPMVSEVHAYKQEVYKTVVDAILTHPSLEPAPGQDGVKVDQNHPMWALFMGFEHERIHFETSSVLFREAPFHLVQTPENWAPMHPSATDKNHDTHVTSNPVQGNDYPANRMIPVAEGTIDLGKPADFPSFGWDNEYGERNMQVPPFQASEHMITNG